MGTPLVVGHQYRQVFQYAGLFRPSVNVTYFQVGSIIGAGITQEQLTNQISVTMAPRLQALMTDAAIYLGVSTQDITVPHPQPIAIFDNGAAGPGTRGSTPQAAMVSGIITLQTGLAGRANRGRFYMPFPDESDNTGSAQPSPANTYLVALGLLAAHLAGPQTFVIGANGVVTVPQIFHRKLFNWTPITATRVGIKWATQRRRGAYKVAHR